MTKLELRIGFPTPSANLWAGRSHWAYKTHQQRWRRYLEEAYLDARAEHGANCWPKPPRAKVRVTVERFTPRENALDVDNGIAGLKPVLDSLTRCELIDGDHADGIELVFAQPKNPVRYPRMWTAITLEKLEAGA